MYELKIFLGLGQSMNQI